MLTALSTCSGTIMTDIAVCAHMPQHSAHAVSVCQVPAHTIHTHSQVGLWQRTMLSLIHCCMGTDGCSCSHCVAKAVMLVPHQRTRHGARMHSQMLHVSCMPTISIAAVLPSAAATRLVHRRCCTQQLPYTRPHVQYVVQRAAYVTARNTVHSLLSATHSVPCVQILTNTPVRPMSSCMALTAWSCSRCSMTAKLPRMTAIYSKYA
jgi:hypothetical protein